MMVGVDTFRTTGGTRARAIGSPPPRSRILETDELKQGAEGVKYDRELMFGNVRYRVVLGKAVGTGIDIIANGGRARMSGSPAHRPHTCQPQKIPQRANGDMNEIGKSIIINSRQGKMNGCTSGVLWRVVHGKAIGTGPVCVARASRPRWVGLQRASITRMVDPKFPQ